MRNPVDGVKIETVKKVEEIDPQALLNQEEYKAVPKELRSRFLKALDEEKNSPFLKPLCYLMYFAGNRVGEALAYQWKDFNFERRFFFVYKSLTKEYEFDEQGEVIGTGKTVLKPPKSKEGIRPLPLLDILYEVMMNGMIIGKRRKRYRDYPLRDQTIMYFRQIKVKCVRKGGHIQYSVDF